MFIEYEQPTASCSTPHMQAVGLMLSLRQASRLLLILEAVLMVPPTLVGVIFAGYGLLDLAHGLSFTNLYTSSICVSIIAVLYSGWHLGFRYLRHGSEAARTAHVGLWRIVMAGGILSVMSFFWYQFEVFQVEHISSVLFILYVYGNVFVVPLAHLSLEVWIWDRGQRGDT